MIASTLGAMKFWIWLSCLRDVVLRVLDLQVHAVQRRGIVLHAVAQDGQEVVVESAIETPMSVGLRHGRDGQAQRHRTGSKKSGFHGRCLLW